eukprot:scaffold27596_cov27-Prasinocladus_malaysianus.AAC.2
MLQEAKESGLQPEHHTYYILGEQAARLGDSELLRWAVPKARETYTNPDSEYIPPAEYHQLPPLDDLEATESGAYRHMASNVANNDTTRLLQDKSAGLKPSPKGSQHILKGNLHELCPRSARRLTGRNNTVVDR